MCSSSTDEFGDFDIPVVGSVKSLPLSCSAIQQYPHVFRTVTTLWGSLEFFNYVDSLLYDESRHGREGFDPLVYTELAFLKYVFETRVDEVINPFLSEEMKRQIRRYVEPKDPIRASLRAAKRKAD